MYGRIGVRYVNEITQVSINQIDIIAEQFYNDMLESGEVEQLRNETDVDGIKDEANDEKK